MKTQINKNKDSLNGLRSNEEYQEEDHLQTQYSNINNHNHSGQEYESIKKYIVPIIFMVLLFLICLFSYNFTRKIKDNRDIMMNIIQSESKNHQVFQDQINILVELKQEVVKNSYTTVGKQKDGTQLVHKLQTKLKDFEQKIDNLQKRLERLTSKTSQKQDVAKLAIIQANQIKKQIKLMNNKLLNNSSFSKKQTNAEQVIKNMFTIPKNIWIFSEEYPNYLRKKYIDNIKFYGNLGGFNIQLLNFESAKQLLSKQSFTELKSAIKSIRSNSQINKQSISTLQKKLILLNFLNQYGGIAMDGNLAFTEDIKWIQSILQNKFTKNKNKQIAPQIVGFYQPEKTFQDAKSTQINSSMFDIPILEYFFIAASRNTLFLPDFIKAIYSILQNRAQVSNFQQVAINENNKQSEFYEQIFNLAYRKLLSQKQQQMNVSDQTNRQTAYDYYGLNLINAYYGPLKLKFIYEMQPSSNKNDQISHKIYDQFARTSMDDYTSLYGPIKYLIKLPFQRSMSHYLEGSTKYIDVIIYEDSIIQKTFFPEKPKQKYLKKNPFFSFTQPEINLWEELPKIIWVFQSSQSSIFNTFCIGRIKQMAKESLFQVRQIDEKSLNKYLQSEIIESIQTAIQNTQEKELISNQLYKLAILFKHGGVFLNTATLSIQNFNWILKISNMPTQFIYNCFDSQPKVLMMWDPLSKQPQSWNLKQLDNFKAVKSQWSQALSDDFIAVQKDNQFIRESFNTMKELLAISKNEVLDKFKEYGLDKYGVTGSSQTLSKDVFRYVLAKKQKQLKKEQLLTLQNSAGYYNLWTLNVFSSPYKLKSSFNYQHPKNGLNSYLFAYTQDYVQGIVGKIRYILTFSPSEVAEIDKILNSYINDESKPILDPKSILMKNLRLLSQKQGQNNTPSISIQTSQ